jgi:hypothetical protein
MMGTDHRFGNHIGAGGRGLYSVGKFAQDFLCECAARVDVSPRSVAGWLDFPDHMAAGGRTTFSLIVPTPRCHFDNGQSDTVRR